MYSFSHSSSTMKANLSIICSICLDGYHDLPFEDPLVIKNGLALGPPKEISVDRSGELNHGNKGIIEQSANNNNK